MNMEFPRRNARRSKPRPNKVELPSLLATISAQQATSPTARIQAKVAAMAHTTGTDTSKVDAAGSAQGDSLSKNSPSFNRLAANLLRRST